MIEKIAAAGAVVVVMAILTIFIIPDIEANSQSITDLDIEISEKLEKIESKINKNYGVLCYLSEGGHC